MSPKHKYRGKPPAGLAQTNASSLLRWFKRRPGYLEVFQLALSILVFSVLLMPMCFGNATHSRPLEVRMDPRNAVYEAGLKTGAVEVFYTNANRNLLEGYLSMQITDFDGSLLDAKSQEIAVRPDERFQLRFAFEMPSKGYYRVVVQLAYLSTRLSASTSFVVVDTRQEASGPREDSVFGLCEGAALSPAEFETSELSTDPICHFPVLGCRRARRLAGKFSLESGSAFPQWEAMDQRVSLFSQHGVQLLGVLDCNCTGVERRMLSTDGELAQFCDYVRETVSRYEDNVHWWEVCNEPNRQTFGEHQNGPEDYFRLLKGCYEAAKEIDPDCHVIAGSTFGTDLSFLDEIFSRGALNFMDCVSIHPYQANWEATPNTALDRIKLIEDLFMKYGKRKPVWITQLGWKTEETLSEKQQAICLPKFMLTALCQPSVEKVYWSNLSDANPIDGETTPSYGFCHADGTPKPSFLAFRELLMAERASNYEGKQDLGPELTVHVFSEKSGRGQTRILWSRNAQKNVRVKVVGRKHLLQTNDVIGRPVPDTIETKEGTLVRVGPSPVYLSAKDPITLSLSK